ncbi:MAG: hypothetical protein QOH95_577 [Gaiellaceae bacterium]|jgi:hypothetical protein|nr:hypothetical protein [Gaiellaceae bacterium]
MMLVEPTKRCSLSLSRGTPEECWGTTCAFWQDGGDDLPDGCAVERLELDRHGVDVADFLLSLRDSLEPRTVVARAPEAAACLTAVPRRRAGVYSARE